VNAVLEQPRPTAATARERSAQAAVRLAGVSKVYGELFALRDIDLQIASGSTVVLLGANGAGKSTLLNTISGLVAPSEGTVAIHGQSVKESCQNTGARLGVLSHKTMLYDRLTGRENLALHAALQNVSPARIEIVLEQVDLAAAADRRVAEYSHGMRKRLALARALLHEPTLLVLDEPFSGLDQASQERLSHILRTLRPSQTVVFSTHDADKALAHGDRLLMLEAGRVVTESHHDRSASTPEAATEQVHAGTGKTTGSNAFVRFLRAAWLVLRKDLIVEVRARSVSSAMLIFAGLLATVLGMAFEPLAGDPRVLSGVLWVLITFAVMHGLARSFDGDFQDDALRGLLLTGADPAAIYLGKVLSNTLFLLLVSLLSLGLIGVFFATPTLLQALPGLLVLMMLAALGLTAVGGIVTVISRHSSLGETLLPILFLPLIVPVLLAGIASVPVLLETGLLDGGWLRVLLFYDLGMLVATTVFFEYLLEA
jgi:heme exporter protein A